MKHVERWSSCGYVLPIMRNHVQPMRSVVGLLFKSSLAGPLASP